MCEWSNGPVIFDHKYDSEIYIELEKFLLKNNTGAIVNFVGTVRAKDKNNKNILIRGDGSLMGKLNQTSPTLSNFSIKNIYPNPFNSTIPIQVDNRMINPFKIQIFNLSGKLLETIEYKNLDQLELVANLLKNKPKN